MYDTGKITGYRMNQGGTELRIFVPRDLQDPITRKQMRQVGLWLDDGRHITAEQRKKAYATIADISRHTGYLPEEQKEWLKYLHISRTGCPYFSLSDCSVDTAREFINTILDYALEEGIVLDESGLDRTDDISHYLYACIKNKKCAICGKGSEIHHWDAIGMGNNRTRIDDSNYRKISLCRYHHTLAHSMGNAEFGRRYKVYGIVVKDVKDVTAQALA